MPSRSRVPSRAATLFASFACLALAVVACSTEAPSTRGGDPDAGEDYGVMPTPPRETGPIDTPPKDASADTSVATKPDSGTSSSVDSGSTCTPQCRDRECGGDLCGGSCGTCTGGKSCSFGKCTTCTPSCFGKTCGSDGCGGTCGECTDGFCLSAGSCGCTQDSDCASGSVCDKLVGAATGKCLHTCDPWHPTTGCAAGTSCSQSRQAGANWPYVCVTTGTRLEGDYCFASATGHDCAPGLVCVGNGNGQSRSCMRPCDDAHTCRLSSQRCVALTTGSGTSRVELPVKVCVSPDNPCSYRCVGPHMDRCVWNIESTPETTCTCFSGYVYRNGRCIDASCVPSCNGKTCGDDGCGGSCGACTSPASCTSGGTCCAPACSGKTCGDDGCGGSCGTCTGTQTCNASGSCEVCVPKCDGKTCGSDGCGGSCGSCPFGQSCTSDGTCACVPKCSGKTCGDDGCGGTCGTCRSGESCFSGQCQACDPVSDTGCAATEGCFLLSSERTACGIDGRGTQGASCSASVLCAGGHACFAGTCRKVCDMRTSSGCSGTTCKGVSGWSRYGACE
ncbi:MAG: hypothetical protein U0169_15660 [Polyangiaceae bacterium]